MKKLWFALFLFTLVGLLSCGGGGGISGSPDQPQTVSVHISESSADLEVGDTFQFHASVNNASNTTITWTVNDVVGGNSTVGTMSVDGLYTAPASVPSTNPVTVKATSNADKTKSDTATVTINPKFAISPASVSVQTGHTQQFTANQTVATNGWMVNNIGGGNTTIGTISSSGLYTAPASVPSPATVTVKAVLASNNSKTATASVTITGSSPPPSSLTITPTSATVAAGATRQFTANVPVNWTVSSEHVNPAGPDVIGSISASGLYTAPLFPPWTGEVTVTATSKDDPGKTATATVTITFATASFQGPYAIRYRGFDNDDAMFLVGRFYANGSGGISNGVMDVHIPGSSATVAIAFTGTYSVGTDGRGTMELTADLGGGPVTLPLRFVMFSRTSARIIGFDDVGSGWGSMEQQDPAALAGGLSGTYVYMLDGISGQLSSVAAAGMFTAASNGSITGGLEDINEAGTASSLNFTGNWNLLDEDAGRGEMTLTVAKGPHTFYFYLLDASNAFFISQGGDIAVQGILTGRNSSSFSNASLDGGVAFASQGYTPAVPSLNTTTAFSIGRFVASGTGSTAEEAVDSNVNGIIGSYADAQVSGTYSIAANGRGTFNLTAGPATTHLVVYMISANNALYVATDPQAVATGQLLPTDNSFSSIRRGWAFTLRGTYTSAGRDATGAFIAADVGATWTGAEDYNNAGSRTPNQAMTATYSVSGTNGRGTATISAGSASVTLVIYELSSSGDILLLGTSGGPLYGYASRQY